MQELQDDGLGKILRDKLSNYEVTVQQESKEAIFKQLQTNQGTRGAGKVISYSVALVGAVALYFFFDPSQSPVITETIVASALNDKSLEMRKPEASHASDQTLFSPTKGTEKQDAGGLRESSNKETGNGVQPGKVIALMEEQPASTEGNKEGNLVLTDSQISQPVAAVAAPAPKRSDSSRAASVARPATEKVEKTRVRFNISLMPFMSYRRLIPNGSDMAHLSGFTAPSSMSVERMGMKVSFSLDFEVAANKYIFGGLSYFTYQTKFGYDSNEESGQIKKANEINERVQGVGLLVGGRYPLKLNSKRKQFVSAGFDAQFLVGDYYPLTSANQFMINAGYANDFELGGKRILRIQPTINYSITKFQYAGVGSQPYWLGLDITYSWGLR